MERRFIRRVSVGLIVLAPKPLAWVLPGMMEARFEAEDGVDALLERRGERDASDRRLDSDARTFPKPGIMPG